jgi:hypothetical protein
MQPLNIQVDILCQISPDKVNAYLELLKELMRLVNAERLKRVIIVPDNAIAAKVNEIIESYSGNSNAYIPGPYPAPAVTVPIEINEDLICFIIIGERVIQEIKPERYHPYEAVSSTLEELLHVFFYSATWKRQGFLHYQGKERDSCKADLLNIVSRMQDEYVVGRFKTALAASNPLFDNEQGSGLSTGGFRYGDSIKARLDNAAVSLGNTIIDATSATLDISTAWNQLLNNLYRDILEPLARDSAFRSRTTDEALTEQEALGSQFFKNYFAGHWNIIRAQLERTINSEFSDSEIALNKIVDEVRDFLRTIGVVFRETEDHQCWIDFYSDFFQAYNQEVR